MHSPYRSAYNSFILSLALLGSLAGSAFGQNIVSNPGFESGTAPWKFYSTGEGVISNDAPGSGSQHGGKVVIRTPGSDVQLLQADLTLEADSQYALTFKAYSNSGHDLAVYIQENDPPNKPYSLVNTVFDLTTTWKVFSMRFTASGFSGAVDDACLRFLLEQYVSIGDEYFFDDVVLTKAGPEVPPGITAQPAHQAVNAGESATFDVVATGTTPLTYQWRMNGVDINAATAKSYTTPASTPADSGSAFTVVVTNIAGTVTSTEAILTVRVPSGITSQPAPQTVNPGAMATFRVDATGTPPLTYRWQKDGFDIKGATDTAYTTLPVTIADDGASFSVIVTNAAGTITSDSAILSVNIPAGITSQPLDQTVTEGETATFTVTAFGTEPLSYRWQRNGALIDGATSASYTTLPVTIADSGAVFSVIVINIAGAVWSEGATLSVNPAVRVLSDDFSSSVFNTSLWTFVNPGVPSTLKLVGRGTTDALLAIVIPGGSSHNLWSGQDLSPRILQAISDADFEVEVKFQSNLNARFQAQGILVQQDSANFLLCEFLMDGLSTRLLTASFVAGIPTVRLDLPIVSGNPLYLRVHRSGDQWTQSYSQDGVIWVATPGFMHALAVRSVGPVAGNHGTPESNTPAFSCLIDYFFNTSSPIAPEDSATSPPIITRQPQNATVHAGQTAVFDVIATGTGPLSYRWQKNGTDISGAIASSYTTPAATLSDSGALFRVIVSNVFDSITSSTALLVVTSGTPTLSFRHVIIDSTGPRSPNCKTIGDIDGDGFIDALAASSEIYLEGIFWYKYPDWTKYNIHPGSFNVDMQTGDIDHDGDLDVIIPQGLPENNNSVWWYENPRPGGDPRNGPWAEHFIGNAGAHDVELGDINSDGKLDVVVRRHGATSIFFQNSPDSWSLNVVNSVGDEGIALGDIDGDADTDIAIDGAWLENPLPGGNPASGGWPRHLIDGDWPDRVAAHISDINKDGRADVIFAPAESENGRFSWYETTNPRTGPWTQHIIADTVSYLHGFKTGDMDNDGDLDLVTAEMHQSSDPDEISVYLNQQGAMSWTKFVVATTGLHNLRIGDFGNDGDLDVFGANWNEGAPNGAPIEMWENLISVRRRSLDSWARRIVDPAKPWRAMFITSADIDRDGKKDIVTGGWWYRNPGSAAGTWTRNTIGSPVNQMAAVHDFDNDGDVDVLGTRGMGSAGNSQFAWGRNNGSGSFTVLTNITSGQGDFLQGVAVGPFQNPLEVALSWHEAGHGIQMLTVPANPSSGSWSVRQISTDSQDEQISSGDIDRDGDNDLVLGTKWLQNGGSTWSSFQLNGTTGDPDRNRLSDINRDGRLDIVVGFEAISVPGKLAWYEQPASATDTWTEHIVSNSVIGPMSLDVADMDEDGDPDLVVGEHNLLNSGSARMIILENKDGFGNSWAQHIVYTGDEHHDGAQVVDIDNDGDLDILSIGWNNPRVAIYENTSEGLFTVQDEGIPATDLFVRKELNADPVPEKFILDQNYPNPFNPVTTIHYGLPIDSPVRLTIFNVLGQEIATLVDRDEKAGYKSVEWNATSVASGVYFYRLQAGIFNLMKHMVVVK